MRDLAAQFVLLRLTTGPSGNIGPWSRKYTCENDNAIPQIYVVRGDGKQVYGRAGAPVDVAGFLRKYLKETGPVLSTRDLQVLYKNVDEAQKLLKRGDFQPAVEKVAAGLDTGGYALAARQMDQLAVQLTEMGTAALTDAEKKLADEESAFEGALALSATVRIYAPLPTLKQTLETALASHRKDAAHGELIEPAQRIDAARQLEAEGEWEQALDAYRQIAAAYPRSPAGPIATEKVETLASRVAARTKKPGAKSKAAGSPAADEKRAASSVRLGKLLLNRSPAKAREYFQKAIEQAPDSGAAEEARELLRKL